MRPFLREALPHALLASGIVVFVRFALAVSGGEAAFAACALGLVVAACAGPFCFDAGLKTAALRGALWGAAAGMATLVVGRSAPALLCGLFCGLYAFSLGALAHALRWRAARVFVAMLGLALITTLHVWDSVHLLEAKDRKASADLAFHLNPAAAASVTLDVDWIHKKQLYTGNQTAESMFGLNLRGIGAYSLRLLILAVVCVLAGRLRR